MVVIIIIFGGPRIKITCSILQYYNLLRYYYYMYSVILLLLTLNNALSTSCADNHKTMYTPLFTTSLHYAIVCMMISVTSTMLGEYVLDPSAESHLHDTTKMVP